MENYIAAVSPLEANLMARVQNHDDGAFNELFTEFQERVYWTARRILKEDCSAQDALQETFVNVYRGAKNFRGDSRLSTWINRITVNVCFEMIRKNKKHSQRLEPDISETTELQDPRAKTPFEETSQTETSQRVHMALKSLGDKHSRVVLLHDLEGYTITEISEIIGVPAGTIKSRLFYGRKALKKRLVH